MKKIYLFLTSALLTTPGLYAQYCAGGPSSTFDTNVQGVVLNGNSTNINYTGCPGVAGLEDQTAQAADLVLGSTYSIDITWGTCGGSYSNGGEAWIDFDGSQSFEPGESIGSIQWGGGVGNTQTYNFTVPVGATVGTWRMRVTQQEGYLLPLDPCASYTWGSMVDFTINIIPPPAGIYGVQNILCNGDLGQMTASYSAGTAPISFSWDNGDTTATITNLTAGTYCVVMTDALMNTVVICDSVLDFSGPPMGVYAHAQDSWICTDSLGVLVIDSLVGGAPATPQCGLSSNSCTTVEDTIQNATLTSFSTQTGYPSPLGNYYYGTRHQMNYTAYEMLNAGLVAGNISGIALYIDNLASAATTLSQFKIEMGCSPDSVMNAFNNSTVEVYPATNTTITTGWNWFTFATPFYWNGVDNIIVETCFNNTNWTENPIMGLTTTSYASTVYYTADISTVCGSSSVTSNSTSRPIMQFANCDAPSGYTYIYSWNNGSTLDSTMVPAGIYVLNVLDDVGCADSIVVKIDESAPVNVDDMTTCITNPTDLVATPGFDTYVWNTGGTDNVISILTGGQYYVDAVDSLGCPTSDTAFVTGIPAPVLAGSSGPELYGFDGAAIISIYGNAYPFTIDWDNDGTGDNDDQEDQYNLTAGTYTVVVTDTNGCYSTLTIVVESQLGLDNLSSEFNIYPNPTSGMIYVQALQDVSADVRGEIMDISGKVIAPVSFNGKNLTSVDMTTFESGIYFITIYSGDDKTTAKVIKQ